MVDEQIFDEVMELRSQGLSDRVIVGELRKKGYDSGEVQAAIARADEVPLGVPPPGGDMPSAGMEMPYPEERQAPEMYLQQRPEREVPAPAGRSGEGNIYERIEEITESMIDEKWDELIAEVKKIVQWKEGVEERQARLANDLAKLKDDFKILHEGVLGKLEGYDSRMRDVGTELKAVGKVFKDVIPEFVENVKELKGLKNELKRG